MFNLKDRKGAHMVLGPTHEELFTYAAKAMVRSYKDLPFTLYQQADKFRDEPRPRFGLIRVREFVMKDAYSFDRDDESLQESYNNHQFVNHTGLLYPIIYYYSGIKQLNIKIIM